MHMGPRLGYGADRNRGLTKLLDREGVVWMH